jgi:alpha-mannosidase
VADGKLMLSLMRSARLISYGFIGGYEPGVGSDTGLGIGRKYTLNYALVPHEGDWRSATPWRSGLEFNNPLIVQTVAPHPGELPAKWGLLEVSNEDAVTSALKPGKDGTVVVRIYEAAGQPSHAVRATWRAAISQVHEANLIEDTGAPVNAQADRFVFDLKPYEIKTFKLTVKPAGTGASDTIPSGVRRLRRRVPLR